MGEHTGKAKEVVGWATGDREVEAKGRVEHDVADPDDDADEVTGDAVADEKLEVRHEHGEYDPDK
jgi:uncharacterized protein YjbJ (UPF0337 family)